MAIVKCKPTSPGRRHVVKILNSELYKGKPYALLLKKKIKVEGVIIMVELLHVILVVDIKGHIVL